MYGQKQPIGYGWILFFSSISVCMFNLDNGFGEFKMDVSTLASKGFTMQVMHFIKHLLW